MTVGKRSQGGPWARSVSRRRSAERFPRNPGGAKKSLHFRDEIALAVEAFGLSIGHLADQLSLAAAGNLTIAGEGDRDVLVARSESS